MLLIKIMSISRSSPSFIYLSVINANILVKPNGSKQSWISEQCFLCYVCHFARYWADRWVLTCHSKLQKKPIKSMHEIMVSTNQRSVVPISQYLWFVTRGHGNDPGLEGESVRLEIICGVLSEFEWMLVLSIVWSMHGLSSTVSDKTVGTAPILNTQSRTTTSHSFMCLRRKGCHCPVLLCRVSSLITMNKSHCSSHE